MLENPFVLKRKLLYIILISAFVACKEKPQNIQRDIQKVDKDEKGIHEEEIQIKENAAISVFDLIKNKKESPENFPEKFDFSKNYTSKVVEKLGLDTNKIGANEYYFLTGQKFLKKKIKGFEFNIYYKHIYGVQLQKILRIEKTDTVLNKTLAMKSGDGQSSRRLSTAFINDSVFVEYMVRQQTLRDEPSVMEHAYDSIVTTYCYDNQFVFQKTAQDTFHYSKEIIYKSRIKWVNLKVYSEPFYFQEEVCVWEYLIEHYHYMPNSWVSYKQNLINKKTGKSIMDGTGLNVEMFSSLSELFNRPPDYTPTLDVNFDGYIDITLSNNVKSGSAGEFIDSYVYKPEKNLFEYSQLHSGYYLTVDEKNKVLRKSSSGGGGLLNKEFVYFDEKSNLKFISKFKSDYRNSNRDSLVFSYKKIIDGKIVEQKEKIVPPDVNALESIHSLFSRWAKEIDSNLLNQN
jgi:hypothetical protein